MSPPAAPYMSLTPGTQGHVRLIYSGFLIGLLLPGINVAAAAAAWFARGAGGEVMRLHYANQISIFWKSVVYVVIGLVLTYFLFGVLIIMAAVIWYILRVVKALQALAANAPPENPQSWLF